jgi:hypothetical protein
LLVDVLIKKKRLEWVGRVARMDHRRVIEKIFGGKPEGSKKGKAVLLQAWSGREGSKKLRFPD